jgi:hypothetical protein
MWVMEYLDDVTCDLLAFFRIEDPDEELTSAQFFKLAYRLPGFRGAVRHTLEAYANAHADDAPLPADGAPITQETLASNPRLQGNPMLGQEAPLFDYAAVS